jgi:hypothetical protein
MWFVSHELILKLSHALIKHKNFINYILPRPNHLPNHIDLSQLNSSIHISQLMNLYHIPLIITSQYKLNRWTNSFFFVWIVWLSLYGVFMLCYFLAIVVRRTTCLVERREASCSSERQVTHISLTHFTHALVYFTSCSMHDRCFTQLFYQMLRS